jgi:hypothetical protein
MDRGRIRKEDVRHCGTTSTEGQTSDFLKLLLCLSAFFGRVFVGIHCCSPVEKWQKGSDDSHRKSIDFTALPY